MVERRWRAACKRENESPSADYNIVPFLPSDSELATAFTDRKKRSNLAQLLSFSYCDVQFSFKDYMLKYVDFYSKVL